VSSYVHAVGLWVVPLIVVACDFNPSTKGLSAQRDGSPSTTDASGNMLDADPNLPDADPNLPDANPDCLVWQADFTSDPTMLELNGDAQPDWVEGDGNSFSTNERSGGLCTPPFYSDVLDTNPKPDFKERTILTGNLRSTEVSNQRVTVFLISLDYTVADFAPILSECNYSPTSGIFQKSLGNLAELKIN
jgi:hypothetical protein